MLNSQLRLLFLTDDTHDFLLVVLQIIEGLPIVLFSWALVWLDLLNGWQLWY